MKNCQRRPITAIFDSASPGLAVRYGLAALLFLSIVHFFIAAFAPLSPDETYYWLWSRNLQSGYYDHPPMVALWIRAGEWFAGRSSLGVRFLAPLASALGSVLMWRAAEDFFPGRSAGLIACCLFNATLLSGVGSILMTPDTPLLLFWTAAIAALGRWVATDDDRWWAAVGLAAGAALLSKYTAVFLIVATGLWLLTTPERRGALRRPWPWAGLVLALAVFAPNVAWNAAHGWVSYLKQGARLAQAGPSRMIQSLAELALGQIGMATPFVFGLAAIGVWRLTREHSARSSLLPWLTILPAAVFVEHAMFDSVQPQWPAIIYPSACIAAAGLPIAVTANWLRRSLALGFALTTAAYVQVLAAPLPLPASRDPVSLQLAGWNEFAASIAARNRPFITADGYATLSEIAYYAPPGIVVAGFDPRWAYFDMPSAQSLAGVTGLMIGERKNPASPCVDATGLLERKRNREVVWTYKLCDFVAPETGVLLPR